MKLLEITFRTAPKIPGVRASDLAQVNLLNPPGSLKGWRVSIRGAAVFFISPPGWKAPGRPASKLSVMHEVPRMNCFLYWEGEAKEIADVAKFDSLPFGEEEAPAKDETPAEKKPSGLLDQVPGIL